jgi:phospholipid-binding lipoprotein MlaA
MKGITTVVAMLTISGLSACANTPPHEDVSDPLEPVNRVIDTVNDKLDRAVIKPTAQVYQKVVPDQGRQSITNFFNNLLEVNTIANDLFQGKGHRGLTATGRFVVNSTLGLGGLFDPATQMGLTRHDEDFGQTLGYWGVGEGWYVVLPLLGPSTVRDTAGLTVDYQIGRIAQYDDVRVRNSLWGLRLVDSRANLLSASKIRDTAALDSYLFTRQAYRQLRWSRIHDGNPPPVPFDYDEYEDEDE